MKRYLKSATIPLWIVAVLFLANACSDDYFRGDGRVFGEDIDLGSNYGNDAPISTRSDYSTTNDLAIGNSNGSFSSDTYAFTYPQIDNNYSGGSSSYGQSNYSASGDNTTPTLQLNGFSTIGSITFNEVPQRSYPGNSYAVANQDFVPTGSSDDGFNFITQEFGTPLYTPLGSGWLILVAAGAGYALVKRRKKD